MQHEDSFHLLEQVLMALRRIEPPPNGAVVLLLVVNLDESSR